MSDGLIPMRYAKALYKFAAEQNKTADVYDIMNNVIIAFERNPEMQKVMANSFVSCEDKKKLLLSAAGGDSAGLFNGFVNLFLQHRRESFAQSMALAYRDLYRKENNISRVVITTASAADNDIQEKLKQLVENSFKGTTLEVSFIIDPEIIAGFIIGVDQMRMDASLSSELEQLRHKLLSK